MEKDPVITLDQNLQQFMASTYANNRNYFSREMTLITDFGDMKQRIIINQPFRPREPRLVYVRKGHADVFINMRKHVLEEGMLAILPVNCIFSVISVSKDFTPLIIAGNVSVMDTGIVYDTLLIKLPDVEKHLVETFFSLAIEMLNLRSPKEKAIKHLFLSLFHFSTELYRQINDIVVGEKKKSASERIMEQFIHLIMEDGGVRRDIQFYAKKLQVTPNYLSIVVKKETSSTVSQWCNRRLALEAQMLLKASRNLSLSEISDMLGFHNPSQFGTFFKKETGMTPMEYRNGKEIPPGEAEQKINR